MSVRNEIISIEVGESFVYPISLVISSGVGKGYNTCTMVGDTSVIGEVGDIITISVNGDIHTFLIDMKDYGKENKVTFKCKGKPCILEDISPTDTHYSYLDSDELIADSQGSIIVVNNLPTIIFSGQSYAKVSTPMSRILDMVNVVGGQAYEVNGTLHLDELKVIPMTPIIAHSFSDSEIFDYAYSDNRSSSNKVKSILINPITDDILGIPSSTLVYNDEAYTGEVYFNPSLTKGYTYTISGLGVRDAVRSVHTETISVEDETYITTIGGIDAIVSIKINGVPLDFDSGTYFLFAGWNVVRFNTIQNGEVEVTYYTKSVSVYAYRTTDFKITYQCTLNSGTIEVESGNVINNGFCYTEIVEPHTYEDGGTVLISHGESPTLLFVEFKGATNLVTETYTAIDGGTATIQYLYGTTDWDEADKSFMNNITSSIKNTIETTNKEILYDEDLDEYVVFLDKPITSINDIYFGSSALTGFYYDDTGDIPRIVFQDIDVGKEVDISMNIELVELVIPAPTVGNPVRLLDVISCGGVATTEYILADNVLCSLPATFKVDVAESLGVPIEDCFGAEVTGDLGSLIVDNFGKVEVTISTQGIFVLNCNNIKDDAIITINSEGVQ